MLELIKMVYWDYWSMKYKNSDTKETMKEDNVALYADGQGQSKNNKKPRKKYKGDCSWCGIQGHKAVDGMKRKAVENKSNGTRIPENQKKCYRCKADGHITKNCLEKKANNTGNAFFIGMCDDKENEEEEEGETEEEDIGFCLNCGGSGMVGLECVECKDSGLVYENKPEIYHQPETQNTQETIVETWPRYMELLTMTKLHKENDILKEKERTLDWNTDGALSVMPLEHCTPCV